MNKLSLREYKKTSQDRKLIFPLMKYFLKDYYGVENITNQRTVDTIIQLLATNQNKNEAYFFRLENQGIIGFCIVVRGPRLDTIKIQHFYILPGFRRNKECHWGTSAFQLVIEKLKPSCVMVEVILKNEIAKKFWISLGFTQKYESKWKLISGIYNTFKFDLNENYYID